MGGNEGHRSGRSQLQQVVKVVFGAILAIALMVSAVAAPLALIVLAWGAAIVQDNCELNDPQTMGCRLLQVLIVPFIFSVPAFLASMLAVLFLPEERKKARVWALLVALSSLTVIGLTWFGWVQ